MRHRKLQRLMLPLFIAAFMLDWTLALPEDGANQAPPAPAESTKPKVATEPAPKQEEKKSKQDDRVILEWADELTHDANTKMHHFRGHVVFANRDMKLYCDAADYNEADSTAKATGHLRITNPDTVITGDLVQADFNKEVAIVTGHVTIITQKKPNPIKDGKGADEAPNQAVKNPPAADGAKGLNKTPQPPQGNLASKNESGKEPEHIEDYWAKKTVITCDRLEYYYGDNEKRMIATPRVKAVQEDKTLWADKAVYEDIPRLITLTGNVIMQSSDGTEMHCNKAVVSVDNDWIQAEGASGMTLRKPKNGGQGGGAAPAASSAPAPAPGSPPPPEASTPSPPATAPASPPSGSQ